jgi:hypothetical protein
MTTAPVVPTVNCSHCGLPMAVMGDDAREVIIAGVAVRGRSGRGLIIRCPNPKCRHVGTWGRGRPQTSPLDISDKPVQDS